MAGILETLSELLGITSSASPTPSPGTAAPATGAAGFGAGVKTPNAAATMGSSGLLSRRKKYDAYAIEAQSGGESPMTFEEWNTANP